MKSKDVKNVCYCIIIMCMIFILTRLTGQDRETYYGDNSRVLVCYAYYEKNTERHMTNLEFFLKEGYGRFKNFKNVDIYLCINGGKCNVKLPEETENFKIIRRKNEGFDFGAHAEVINKVIDKYGSLDKCPYDTYVFLNGSQRGPFLPVYWRPEIHWSTIFSDKFKESGLVGCCKFFHPADKKPTVETWAFALRPDALKVAWENGTIFVQQKDKHSACKAEDNLTRLILENGIGIDSLQLKFSRDKSSSNINNYKISSRPWSYEDISLNPLETVFYKTYWDSGPDHDNGYNCPFEQRYTEWILGGSVEHSRDVYPLYNTWRENANNRFKRIGNRLIHLFK